MFTNILVATDGSRLAAKGVSAGIRLARKLGARVTAVHVIPPYIPAVGDPFLPPLVVSRREYKASGERNAAAILAAVEREARKAGVKCTKVVVADVQPWGGILRAAHTRKCDAIALGSHGYGAVGGLILGSQTQRVLAHAKIPVLVTR